MSRRSHEFTPDPQSRTTLIVALHPEMATCARCGHGRRYRAHQPWWWRAAHPLLNWR